MAALVNGTNGINIRNCSGLVEAAERNYQLPKGSCGVTAREGGQGFHVGPIVFQSIVAFCSSGPGRSFRGTSPGMLEAKPAGGFSLPVKASLLIFIQQQKSGDRE